MEQNKKAFRLHLNLFDAIVILVAVAAAGVLLWSQIKPAAPSAAPAAEKIQYTIVLKKTVPGTGEQVQPGDALVDVVKNYELGNVVSSETVPAKDFAIDTENGRYVLNSCLTPSIVMPLIAAPGKAIQSTRRRQLPTVMP